MTKFSNTSYTESQQAFLATHTRGRHEASPRQGLSYLSWNEIPDPFYYNVLLTSHVVFLQRLASRPLDLYCFSLHLCRLSPIYISSLGRYISIVALFSRYVPIMTHRHALTHAPVFPRLLIRDPFDMALTRHLWHRTCKRYGPVIV